MRFKSAAAPGSEDFRGGYEGATLAGLCCRCTIAILMAPQDVDVDPPEQRVSSWLCTPTSWSAAKDLDADPPGQLVSSWLCAPTSWSAAKDVDADPPGQHDLTVSTN